MIGRVNTGGGTAHNPWVATTQAEFDSYVATKYVGQYVEYNSATYKILNGVSPTITVGDTLTQIFHSATTIPDLAALYDSISTAAPTSAKWNYYPADNPYAVFINVDLITLEDGKRLAIQRYYESGNPSVLRYYIVYGTESDINSELSGTFVANESGWVATSPIGFAGTVATVNVQTLWNMYMGTASLDPYASLYLHLNTLTNEASAAQISKNYEAYDDAGQLITGTLEYLTQSKTVTPSTVSQTVTPTTGFDALSSVVVNATPLTQSQTITPSAVEQTVSPSGSDIGLTEVIVQGSANLVANNITNGVSIFGVTGNVIIYHPEQITTNLAMSTGDQVIVPVEGNAYTSVTIIKPTTLTAENIKVGIDIGGVTGTYDPNPVLQDVEATPELTEQIILPDMGYDGLSSVTIAATPLDATQTITPTTTNQTINPTGSNIGLAQVVVEGSANMTAANIASGVSIFGVTGTLDFTTQAKTVNAATSQVIVTPDASYNGLSSVTINAVTNAIDSNITPANIASGVSILGVTGVLEGGGIPGTTYTKNIAGSISTYSVGSLVALKPSTTSLGSIPAYSSKWPFNLVYSLPISASSSILLLRGQAGTSQGGYFLVVATKTESAITFGTPTLVAVTGTVEYSYIHQYSEGVYMISGDTLFVFSVDETNKTITINNSIAITIDNARRTCTFGRYKGNWGLIYTNNFTTFFSKLTSATTYESTSSTNWYSGTNLSANLNLLPPATRGNYVYMGVTGSHNYSSSNSQGILYSSIAVDTPNGELLASICANSTANYALDYPINGIIPASTTGLCYIPKSPNDGHAGWVVNYPNSTTLQYSYVAASGNNAAYLSKANVVLNNPFGIPIQTSNAIYLQTAVTGANDPTGSYIFVDKYTKNDSASETYQLWYSYSIPIYDGTSTLLSVYAGPDAKKAVAEIGDTTYFVGHTNSNATTAPLGFFSSDISTFVPVNAKGECANQLKGIITNVESGGTFRVNLTYIVPDGFYN